MSTRDQTQQDGDQEQFDEAMAVADISVRRFERALGKLQFQIESLYKAQSERGRHRAAGMCMSQVSELSRLLQTPPVAHWRQKHAAALERGNGQYQILARKLTLARELLAERGVDLNEEWRRVR